MKRILLILLLWAMTHKTVLALPFNVDAAADDISITTLPNEDNITWSMWVLFASTGAVQSFTYLVDGSAVAVWRFDINATPLYRAGSNVTQSTGSATPGTSWTFVAGTRSGTAMKLYVNGSQTADASNTSTETAGAATTLVIGNASTAASAGTLGRIAAVKFWNAVLTTSQIESEMWTYRPRVTASIYGWWPTVQKTITDELLDRSGLGHDLSQSGVAQTDTTPPIGW